MKKFYMVGNTHFDPVWLWRWDEAMSSISATFRSALDRMNEYEDFIYSFATPPVFEWIRRTSPNMFEQIKERVDEGRWELAEGWWVQPDCYSACGESYVRQGLYGQRYLMRNFGRYSDTVFNIDSFGHSPMLPQILAKSGIKYYAMCRPEGRHIELESPLFNWRSADGSTVLAYRDDAPYKKDIPEAMDAFGDFDGSRMMVYGVTDHGGAPTKKAIEDIKSRDDACFSTVSGFFKEQKTDYTVEKELLTGDFGVYANHGEVKALNRIAEYALLNAERSSVISGEYDSVKLEKCWQDVLFNQFHDILGGASIKDAYFDARNSVGGAIATANEITHFNLLRITNDINMPGKNPDNAWNIVVWNLNAIPFEGYIEAETQWMHEFPWYDKGIELEDADGVRYPCQIIREKSVIPRFRSRFVFKAEIPAIGYKAFKVVQTGYDIAKSDTKLDGKIRTENYEITFSGDGMIESIYDLKCQKKIAQGILRPACFRDDGDTWAFNIDSYGEELEAPTKTFAEIIESGEHRTVIRVEYKFRSSIINVYYTVYENEKYIDVRYKVNWNEKHIALKLVSDVDTACHRVAVPYGSVHRENSAADVPMGEWLECSCMTFMAKRIFAYNLIDGKLGLTLLRSPIYGDLRIREIDLDTDYDIMEQGICEGEIRVAFDEKLRAEEAAVAFNNSPIVLCESNHGGKLPAEYGFIDVKSESAMVTVLKFAEEDESVIIRGVEYRGESQKIKICVFDRTYEVDISPYEIFTVKLKENLCEKVDMLERS